MQVRLICDNVEAPVSPFIGRFIKNICAAIVDSLKTPPAEESIRFELQGDEVRLQIDGSPVSLGLNQGFAETIIRDTLRGMIRTLKGMDIRRKVSILVDLESTS